MLDGELNIEEGEVILEEVKYSKNLQTQVIWATFRRKEHAALLFMRQAKMKNEDIRPTQRFPAEAW